MSTGAGEHVAPSLPRSPSKESLSTHPLVPAATDGQHTAPQVLGDSATSSPPRYAPYVSRQSRAAQSTQLSVASVPASRALSPQDSAAHPSAATSKLQHQHLKAAAQRIGLNAPSYGWTLLETIVHDGELEEVWDALTVGKATLLLPAEENTPTDKIPVEEIKNHIAFLDHAAISSTPLVTLSGLKGVCYGSVLSFHSSLPSTTKAFKDLKSSSSRRSVLSVLPEPPQLDVDRRAFPTFTLYPNTTLLPLPPRPVKQPQPPVNIASPQPTGTRLGLPFVSLFGSRSSSSTVSTPPRASTPTPETDRPLGVATIIIDKRISVHEVGKHLVKSFKQNIRDVLRKHGVAGWVTERVEAFLTPLYPFVKTNRGTGGYQVQEFFPDDLSTLFQDFYEQLEIELRSSVNSPRRLQEKQNTDAGGDESQEMSLPTGTRIRETLEIVESLMCTQLYDKLFRPETTDDDQHDDALSSRIAALNMLDLSLETLGVDVGDHSDTIGKIVARCGQALAQLEAPTHHSPASKSTVLVDVHHLLADGLSRIPPLKLKPEGDIPQPPPVAPNEQRPGAQELQPIKFEDKADQTVEDTQPLSKKESAATSTPVSGDILLPLIIYAVVKSNPVRLVSHLLYVQRFRNKSLGGEGSYCLVNLMAVVEFLEHVDLTALGLSDVERILSAEKLSPIPLDSAALDASQATAQSAGARLRGLVVQEVDAFTGSANKVLTGVVGTSFGMLRGLLATGGASPASLPASAEEATAAPWNEAKPGFGLLRRASGFSIASMAASLPGGARKPPGVEDGGQQMIDVASSRAPSVFERHSDDDRSSGAEDADSDVDFPRESLPGRSDARSIRSFSSMMSTGSKDPHRRALSDRLAGTISKPASGLQRETLLKPPPPRKNSVSRPSKHVDASSLKRISPPNKRFLECGTEDLRLSEIGELLVEYRRVVEVLRSLDVFEAE